jgi:Ca2+-binding EF-hand superfamily protein
MARLLKFGWVIVAVWSVATAQTKIACANEASAASAVDRTTLVIMAPNGPVFADMMISVDARPFRLWVTTFLASRVDLNRDGELTINELQLIPERLLQQTNSKNAKRMLRQSAGDKAAESVTTEKFVSWFANQLSQGFSMIAGAVQPSEAVRLAALVDENGDGNVSRTELEASTRSLRFRDLDDDQTFTAAELMPYRDPRNQQAAIVPDAANLPFVQLSDNDSIARTAEQIIKRYGRDADSTVAIKVLRLSGETSADANADGLLDLAELKSFLHQPVHHLLMDVQLSDRANASDLVLTLSDVAKTFCQSVAGRRGRHKLVLDGMPIEIRSRGGTKDSRSFMVNFLLQRMSTYDEDKNGYLTIDEFPGLRQQLATQLAVSGEFSDVDLNKDEMLLRDEIKEFIERDAIATQSRIEVSVKQDGKTLFKLLDANTDRRLTHRELREGFDVLLEYDINKDEQLTESELGTAYTLEIGLGQAEAFRMDSMQSMSMAARSTDAILPGVSGLSGPEWFRRMDRNQDRDVSYREFLGPKDVFTQLDKDADGLLSATEAEQLTADN